jgi:pyruvate, orthophosphate dikinase
MTWVTDSDERLDLPFEEITRKLGGKGANLMVMAVDLGLPVPPAFTIGTEACRAYLTNSWPEDLDAEIRTHLASLEAKVDRRFGDPSDPLLVSVRSGAPVSMPGMMDTILDLGLNEETTRGLATVSGDPPFAADCRARFVEMYTTVVGVDVVPDDPWQQLRTAVEAVFRSWNSERAVAYRRREGIPDDFGTAVTVQAMVFGNRSDDSGSGVLFTRNPATGETSPYGDILFRAQGEDVVSGTHRTDGLAELATRLPAVSDELERAARTLERHHADLCDIEFTIEAGRLWLLQCRIGKRSPQAALRMAVEMAEAADFPLTRAQAVERVASILADPPIAAGRPDPGSVPLATGLPASPGLASGEIATTSDAAISLAEAGRPVILVRSETSPDDVPAMARSAGLLTSHGGLASHAAVVARGWGIPAVVGAASVVAGDYGVSIAGRQLGLGGTITIDGSTGHIYDGIVTGTAAVIPEIETLLGWARELGIEIPVGGAHPELAAATKPAESAGSLDRDTMLAAIAIKGFATTDALAEALSGSPEEVDSVVNTLESDGLVERAAGALRLNAEGKSAWSETVARDGAALGDGRGEALLDAFVGLDRRVKDIVTAWQVRAVGGEDVLNDHADAAYDADILARLGAFQGEADAFLAPMASTISRFGSYRARLERAARLAAEGDGRYVASPRVDSYHGIWFELHEDLILLAGRTREGETAAGRA